MVDTVAGQYTIYCDKLNAIGWERSTDERFSAPAARLSSSHAELDPALQRPTDMSRTVEAILAHAQLLAPHHRHPEAINQLTAPRTNFRMPPPCSSPSPTNTRPKTRTGRPRAFSAYLAGRSPIDLGADQSGGRLDVARRREKMGKPTAKGRSSSPGLSSGVTAYGRRRIRRPDGSIRRYRRLTVLAPDNAAAQINLAEAFSKTHGDNTVGPYYLEVVTLAPDAALIPFNYAMHLLCRGHTWEGWAYYQSRLSPARPGAPERTLTAPPWRSEAFAGKSFWFVQNKGWVMRFGSPLICIDCLSWPTP